MWRGTLLILPLFVLIGAGCLIGNHDNDDVQPNAVPDIVTQEPMKDIEIPTSQEPVSVPENVIPPVTDGSDPVTILAPLEISLTSGNFYFDPPLIEAKPGQVVHVTVSENMGLHTFVIDSIGLRAQLADGATFSFTAPQKSGDYAFYCDIGEHRKLGMEGVLRVTE